MADEKTVLFLILLSQKPSTWAAADQIDYC